MVQVYPEEDILKAKIDLLGKTNMVDYGMDIHKALYKTEDVPEGAFAWYESGPTPVLPD